MLQGSWTLVSGEQDGVEIPAADLDEYHLTITGNRHLVQWAGAVLEGTHTIDESQTPIAIDSADSVGPFEGMSLKGIVELDGNQLNICFAAPGQPRPTEFTTRDNKATVLHRWKRQDQ
ncbi:MAG: TIGR03067 domain-containing protein [Planctomycetales bacterium]|nr:TIGR03067 domain-containing protein [Planctomycetales bacterium]